MVSRNCNEKQYFMHYFKHTYLVVLAWKGIQDILIKNNLINEYEFNRINELIIWHDNSKISESEWLPYARKFNPVGCQDKDKVEIEFKQAVRHHKCNNFHHFESLKNYTGSDWKCYIIEMICDYIAMGWEFDSYIFDYYDSNKEKIDLPTLYQEYLDEVLNLLKDPSMHFIEEPLTPKRISYLYFK